MMVVVNKKGIQSYYCRLKKQQNRAALMEIQKELKAVTNKIENVVIEEIKPKEKKRKTKMKTLPKIVRKPVPVIKKVEQKGDKDDGSGDAPDDVQAKKINQKIKKLENKMKLLHTKKKTVKTDRKVKINKARKIDKT